MYDLAHVVFCCIAAVASVSSSLNMRCVLALNLNRGVAVLANRQAIGGGLRLAL
jgi:hypothetical protein